MATNNYSNGKVYYIENLINNKKYIGSTKKSLEHRFNDHKNCFNAGKDKNRKIYAAMAEHDIKNFVINLIEEYPCESKKELRLREAHFIMLYDTIENGYNTYLSIVDVDEKTYKHDWYESNKDRILQMRKDWYDKNRETKIAYQKEYAEKNKDKVKEYQKNYHKENKSHKSKKIECVFCKADVSAGNITTHFKIQHNYDGGLRGVKALSEDDIQKIANMKISS